MNTLLLAENGRPKATIVIGKHPTPAVALAARELQYHIQKISGAVPAVVTANTTAMEEARKLGPLILIGDSEAAREAVGAIRFEPQEYLVELANSLEPAMDTIVLWGDDAGLRDFECTTVPGRVASMSEEFGNACHFTENNRPITVTGIDMDPDCGSLEAWVWPREVPGTAEATILRIPVAQGRHILYLRYEDGKVIVRYQVWNRVNNKEQYLPSTFSAKEWCDKWHHILATYNRVDAAHLDLRLFVDGRQATQFTWELANLGGQGEDVFIGAYVEGICSRKDRPAANFRGAIDEVRISRCVRQPELVKPHIWDKSTSLLLDFNESDGAATVKYDVNEIRNQNMMYEHRCRWPSLFEAHGSLDAVYDFLERSCGVRWYAPGEIGEVYDKNSTLEVDVKVVRRKPAMMHRNIHRPDMTTTPKWPDRLSDWYMVGPPIEPKTLIPNKDRDLWLLRMHLGGTAVAEGASFPGSCADYLKEHPAWFAVDREGQIRMWKDPVTEKVGPSQMCYTHEPLINALVEDIYSHFDYEPAEDKPAERLSCYDPTQAQEKCRAEECKPIQHLPRLGSNHTVHSYSLVPADNDRWCMCQACKTPLDDWTIPRPPNGPFSNDMASSYIHSFTRIVAQRVNALPKKWKGQKWIGQQAYHDWAHYPKMEGFTVEPNVFTWLCLHSRTLWDKPVQDNDRQILTEWRQHVGGERLGVYLYYSKPFSDVALKTNPFNCFPAFCPSQIVSLYTQTKDDSEGYIGFKGMAGVYVEMSAETASFLVDQLELYLTFKLADDPELPGKELIDEFFRRYYGPAAEAMRSLYNGVEQALTTPPEQLPTELNEAQMWGGKGLGNPSRMARCLKNMADAVATTVEPNEAGTSPTFGIPQTPPVVEEIAGTGLSAQSVPRSTEQSKICKDRVDLFRRGVWDYMVEGYKNYWTNPQPADAIAAGSALPILKLRMRWHVTQSELRAIMSGWQAPLELPFNLTYPFSSDELSVVTEWPHELLQMWNEYSIDTNRLVIAVIHKRPALGLPQIGNVRAAGDQFVRSIAHRICAPFTMHSVKAEVIEVVSSQPLLDELLRLGLVDTDRKSVPMVAEIEWSD